MTNMTLVLEAVTPLNGKRSDFYVPKTIKACLAHLRQMTEVEARLYPAEVAECNFMADLLNEEPDHYL